MFNFNDWKSTAVLVSGIILAYIILKTDATTLLKSVNPLDNQNAVNQGFDATYTAITGSKNEMGADIYDFTHYEDGSVKWWASPLWFLDKAGGIN